jgi:hypothetical protein
LKRTEQDRERRQRGTDEKKRKENSVRMTDSSTVQTGREGQRQEERRRVIPKRNSTCV